MTVDKLREDVKKYRRELHQIPEIGYSEFKTQKYIMDKLRELGFAPETICGTGIYLFIPGDGDETIAFRADIDALPVTEESGCEFVSTHSGNMHACGHDGHMAILLGLAKFLSCTARPDKNILLIFQPAEENYGGGADIAATGILEKFNVKSIFALHLFPELDEGVIATAPGPLMAQPTEVNIEITGKSGHGGMPQNGIDSILITAKLLEAYQSIISRSISPLDQGVISFGKISGGTARNIIAEKTRIEGTLRSFDKEVLDTLLNRMEEINRGFETAFKVKIDMEYKVMYLPVVNDKNLVSEIGDFADIVDFEPLMLAEDFSYFQDRVPGVMFFLGARNKGKGYTYPLHNSKFNFDEEVLLKGVDLFVKILKRTQALR